MTTTHETKATRRTFGIAGAAGLGTAALLAALSGGGAPARAAAPVDPPVFSDPLAIDNPYFPFVPGAVKVHLGRDQGERITVVELFRSDTREFTVGGAKVLCRALQETEFEGGDLAEISVNWFAQADDGTVWYFGETVDEYEDGAVSGHGGSWLVGGPSGSDPAETMTVTAPASFMPGNPEEGDEVKPEDLPDGSVEIGTVHRLGRKVRTSAGPFEDCLEMRELHLPSGEKETKWYAPGVGVVKAKGKHEVLSLDASTLQQP